MVIGLGFLRYQTNKIDEWLEYNRNILGGEAILNDDRSVLKLRLDDFAHRIFLVAGEHEELIAYAWEVGSFEEMDALEHLLKGEGVEVTYGSDEDAASRDVDKYFAFTDPMGQKHEIFVSPKVEITNPNFVKPIKGYRTGELGLGHVNCVCKDLTEARKFYEKVMGFRVSDYIRWSDADATFYHCNPRHHSFGFMNECFGQKAPSLHHLMLELQDEDDLGRLYDQICASNPELLILHLGKHSNDQMFSMYLKTPSPFAIEIGVGGLLVNEADWLPKSYDSPKIWGHHPA